MDRKPRRDKGVSRYTGRDTWLLPWIGNQWAVRFDHLQMLLGSRAMGTMQEEGYVQEATARHWLERWQRMGIVEYAPILAGQPSWVWLTRKGLQTFGLEYRYRTPNPGRLEHIYYCNALRMDLEEEEFADWQITWRSERELRAENERRSQGERKKHLPDGEIVFPNGGVIAIEAELSKKDQDTLHEIFYALGKMYREIRYYAPPRIKSYLERTFDTLPGYPIPPARDWFAFIEREEAYWE